MPSIARAITTKEADMKEKSKKVEVVEENIMVLDAGITLPESTRCCWGAFGVYMS